jgi:hypothetical protein
MSSPLGTTLRIASLLVLAVTFSSIPAGAFAQGNGDFNDRDRDRDIDRRDRDRDLDRAPVRRNTDELYKSLIESETERRNLRRSTDPRGTFAPARVIDQPTREMLQARKIINGLTKDADDLARMINEEARRNNQLRPMVGEVLKLRARINLIADRATQQNDHAALSEDLRNLDRDWRMVALRLSQARGMDRQTYEMIEHINGDAKELAQILDIKPQMNRRDLMRYTAAIATDMGNLLEDAEYELGRSQDRDQVLASGRRVRQQAYLLANAVEDQREYDIVLDEYKHFQTMWTPFATSLRQFQNRVLDRHVRRIAESDGRVTELLWIPNKMDRQRLLYLTDSLKRDVDEFFARTPLKLLIDLPDSRSVIPASNEFYGVCANFTDTVNSDDSDDDVIAAFRYIESSHRSFMQVFKQVNSQSALQVLNQIQHGVDDLREGLNMNDHTQGRRSAELAGLIDNLAGHLENETKHWLDNRRATFRTQALQEVQAFSTQARRLNESITLGDNPIQQQKDVSLLFESWRRVYNYIKTCDTEERARLQQLSTQITPALVDLQTLITP